MWELVHPFCIAGMLPLRGYCCSQLAQHLVESSVCVGGGGGGGGETFMDVLTNWSFPLVHGLGI